MPGSAAICKTAATKGAEIQELSFRTIAIEARSQRKNARPARTDEPLVWSVQVPEGRAEPMKRRRNQCDGTPGVARNGRSGIGPGLGLTGCGVSKQAEVVPVTGGTMDEAASCGTDLRKRISILLRSAISPTGVFEMASVSSVLTS